MIKSFAVGTGACLAVGWAYLRHIQLRPGPNRLHWGQQVFGHRGALGVPGVPENTLAAFAYAHKNGAAGVELDTWLSKDGELMVCHDDGLERYFKTLPEGKKYIRECTAHELSSLEYKDDPTGAVRMPTLEQSIVFCKDNYLDLLIEIKETRDVRLAVGRLLDLFDRHGESFMYDHTTVISFSPFPLYQLRKRNPRVSIGILYDGEVIASWKKNTNMKPPPLFLRAATPFWDAVLAFAQTRVTPWVAGASMVAPRFSLYNEDLHARWLHRRILVYLWGFTGPSDVLPSMRQPGVLIASDDKYAAYAMAATRPEEQPVVREKKAAKEANEEGDAQVDAAEGKTAVPQ